MKCLRSHHQIQSSSGIDIFATLNESDPRPFWSLNAWWNSCSGRLAMRKKSRMWKCFAAVERAFKMWVYDEVVRHSSRPSRMINLG